MHSAVTHHAALRYMQRGLGLPIEQWLKGKDSMREADKLALCCKLAELPVDAVRELVLCPAVKRVLACGFNEVTVRLDRLAFVIKGGKVVTVLTADMRDVQIFKAAPIREQQSQESRRIAARRRSRNSRRRSVEVA